MTLYLRNSIFYLQMTDFKELRSKYNQEMANLKERIENLKEEYQKSLKTLVETNKNAIVWVITKVPRDSRHMAFTYALYLSKEGASDYENGESAGRSDGVEWYYRVSKTTLDSLPIYQLEEIRD